MELTRDERTELARLIAQEIKRSGASKTMTDNDTRSERLRTHVVRGTPRRQEWLPAQAPPEPPARGRPGNPAGLSPVEVLNMLDAYALVQAESALELRDGQYGRVRHPLEAAAGDPPPATSRRATARSRNCAA